MEQLIILILIGLISLINWLVQTSGEMREKRKLERRAQTDGAEDLRQHPVPDAPFHPPSDEEVQAEKMRRFMEALGLPVEEEAPPPPPPRPVRSAPQPPPVVPVAAAPVVMVPPSLVTAAAEMPAVRSLRKPVVTAPMVKKEPPRIRRLLSSSHGLRDAIVLSEVLGTPRGLQKL